MSIAPDISVPSEFDALQPAEQLQYVEMLLEKVERTLDGELDQSLVEEVRRRRELHRLHPDQARPVAEVRARLMAKYG